MKESWYSLFKVCYSETETYLTIVFQNKPVIMHYVDNEQFTSVAWSIEQPNIIFFSGEKGSLEVWDITKRKSEPIQSQNISGRAINGEITL